MLTEEAESPNICRYQTQLFSKCRIDKDKYLVKL